MNCGKRQNVKTSKRQKGVLSIGLVSWTRSHPTGAVAVAVMLAAASSGCARVLDIEQDDYINTGMMRNREEKLRTGEPLELNIVCVTPADLTKEGNELLKPSSKITSVEWFKKRPVSADPKENKGRFLLPRSQIYLLIQNKDSNVFGTDKGSALRGSKTDGERVTTEGDIAFPFGALHDSDAVIYVFGRFVDESGTVLPVKPAKFHPPGAYARDLKVRIGVDKARYEQAADHGQYIRIESERRMHGKGDE